MNSDWSQERLAAHVDLLTGFPFKSSEFTETDGVRLLRGDNVGQGRLRWDGVKLWPHPQLGGLAPYLLKEGDVILAMDRPWIDAGLKYARISRRDIPSLLVQRVARLRSGKRLDQAYLRYVIGSPEFVRYVLSVQTGTAVPHISATQIGAFNFMLPPLGEQRRIAGVIGALDDKIEHNRSFGERLASFVDGVFRARFLQGDRRPRGPLRRIASMHKKPVQPNESPDELFEHFSIPAFDDGRVPSIAAGSTILSGKTLLPDGDVVLLSKLNPAVRRIWWPRPTGTGAPICSSEFIALLPSGAPTTFLYAALRNDAALYDEILSHATGTTGSRQRVKPEDILACSVVAPQPDEVAGFDAAARPVYDLSGLLDRESRRITKLREALLPKLVSGAIRVPDSYDPDDTLGTVAEAAGVAIS